MQEQLLCDAKISKLFFEAVNLQHSVLNSYHHRLIGPRFVGRIKLKKAISLLHQCVKRQDELWSAHFLLGKIHQTLENHVLALEHFYLAENLTTPKAYLYSEIAFSMLYKDDDDLSPVLNYSENAMHLEPNNIESHQYHALFCILNDDTTSARKTLEIAYALDESNKLTKTISGVILTYEEGKAYRPNHYELFDRMPYLVPTKKNKNDWFVLEKFPEEVTKQRDNKKGGPFSFDI